LQHGAKLRIPSEGGKLALNVLEQPGEGAAVALNKGRDAIDQRGYGRAEGRDELASHLLRGRAEPDQG
jgi:hypothetical protein